MKQEEMKFSHKYLELSSSLIGETVMLASGGKEPKAEIFKYFNELMGT